MSTTWELPYSLHKAGIKYTKYVNLDHILPRVTKPSRYTGHEWNSLTKNWHDAEVRIALAYPDIYEIGMSNLGLAILYDLLNRHPSILAERVFAPWTDMENALRMARIPLFTLESKRPLNQFDMVGFSLGYELTYTNVLNMLDLAGIPVLATQRGEGYPLIIAGGGCALNPEPMADFIDIFVLGEGEEVLIELMESYRLWKRQSKERTAPKSQFLHQATIIPGIYIPRLYKIEYKNDGTIDSVRPTTAEAPPRITRRWVQTLPPPVTRPVVPYVEATHDRAMVEIQRGCTQGCRFCQAGIIYRPVRERSPEEILEAIDTLLKNTGYSEVALVSLSSSDYPAIEDVVQRLTARYEKKGLSISLPSLRMDSFSLRLAEVFQGRRKTGLTFAPEAGSQRLRFTIGKAITDEDILSTAQTAFSKGWGSLKLYFMTGLPTETMEDVQEIVTLVRRIHRIGKALVPHHLRLRVSVGTFIPKAHTPFQWAAQNKFPELELKHQLLRKSLRGQAIQLSWTDLQVSFLEGVLSRGDRRIGPAIRKAWEMGCRFDGWSEHFRLGKWLESFAACGIDPSFYIYRHRPFEEILPWSHIHSGVDESFLQREWEKALMGRLTPDCRVSPCHACGLHQSTQRCSMQKR